MNEHRIEEEREFDTGANVHSIPQFFAAEGVALWPVWTLGLIALVVILWLRFH